jgi:hypothetical protein
MKRLRRDDMPTYGTLLLEGSLLRIQGAEVLQLQINRRNARYHLGVMPLK